MAKKDKLKLDEFKLDPDLDFDDFDTNIVDQAVDPKVRNKKSRNPITSAFKGTISGATSRIKDPNFLAQTARRSLPGVYGEVFDKADEVTSGISSLYDEAVRDIKPQLSKIAKKVDKLVPAEQKILKSITEKISDLFGDESKFQAPSRDELEGQAVSNTLAEVFGAQAQANEEFEARRNAEGNIRDRIESKRFQSNFGILNSINEGVQRLSAYNDKVTQAYQKKSLELQIRSYFVQSELLRKSEEYFEVFKNQNEAITKNTGLPEFVKIKESERFKELAKGKFYESIQGTLFGNDFIKKGMDRLKDSAKSYIGGIKMSLENAMFALDGIEQLQEMNRMQAEMGLTPIGKAEMAGNIAGSFIADAAGRKLSGKMRDLTEKNPAIMKAGYKAANAATNLPGAIDEFRRSDFMKKKLANEGTTGKIANFGDWLLSLFTEDKPDMSIAGAGNIRALDDPTIMNNKSQRSLVEVIPGYLARILREVTVMSTGNKKAGMTVFDYNSGKFIPKQELAADIRRQLTDKIKSGTMDYHLNSMTNNLLGDRQLTDDQRHQSKIFFSKLAGVRNMNYTPENIMNTRLYSELDPEIQKHIKESLSSKITDNADDIDKEKKQYELSKGMRDIKTSTSDVRGDIELFIKAGYGDILEKQGLVKRNVDGSFEINEDEYYKLVRDEGIVRSDINVKRNISKYNPREALRGIKKTKLYNWFYKLGKGDKKKHSAPMAQDVKRNMGEEAAPGGKSLDLVNMNGQAMAAISAMDDQQKKLLNSQDSRGVLVAIQKDTSDILKLLKSGKGGFGSSFSHSKRSRGAKDGYKDLAGDLVSSSMALMSKTTSDLFDASKKIYTASKDKIAKPLADMISKAWNGKKDKLGEMFKSMFTKAGELATRAFDIGQDIITNKLPNGYKQLAVFAGKAKDKFDELILGAKDVYVKGINSPLLRANLMKIGYYYDQATGTVIKTVKDIKGPVVDKLGNIVLTAEDIANGLVDIDGKEFIGIMKQLGAAAAGLAVKGFMRVKDFIGGLTQHGKGAMGGIKDWFSNKDFGMGFGNEKIYDVLVEIRGILRGEDPPRHEDKKDFKKNFVGPKPQSTFSKNISSAKKSASSAANKLKNKLHPYLPESFAPIQPGFLQRMKNKVMPEETTTITEETEDQGSDGTKGAGLFSNFSAIKDKALGSIGAMKGAKGLKGKAGALFSFLTSNKGEEPKAEEEKPAGKKRHIKKTTTTRKESAPESSGRRKGNWEDRLLKQEEDKKKNHKDFLQADLKQRYKGKNVLDGLLSKAGSLFGMLGGGLSGLFGKAGGLLDVVGTLIGLKGGKAALGAIGKGLMGIVKSPVTLAKGAVGLAKGIGSGVMSGLGVLSKVPGAARAASAFNIVRNVATVGGLALGGTGGAVLGAVGTGLSALGAAISSPVVLGAAAVAAVGYGGYKAYKHFTRDDVDEITSIRMKQYGINDRDATHRFNHYILQLEQYLEEGRVGYDRGRAYLNVKRIEPSELLDIFSIDKNDEEMSKRFTEWFSKRFRPFFLTHQTALFSINNKLKLKDISSLKPNEKIKYLGLIGYESGPYGIDASPFKDLSSLNVDPKVALDAIKALTQKLSNDLSKDKGNKKTGVAPVKPTDVNKPVTSKAPITPERSKSLPNTNVGTKRQSDKPLDENTQVEEATYKGPVDTIKSTPANPGKLVVAKGPIKEGEEAGQYLVLQKGVKLDSLNPELLTSFKGMVQEYGEMTGKKVIVTSGSRTSEEQAALYRKDPSKAAKPGRSLHEFGLALDVSPEDLNTMEKMGLMRKYGFTRPVGGEPWHAEPAAIQPNIPLAKNDPNFAAQAIEASLNRGGGGLGAMPGSPKGRRDPGLAIATMEADAQNIDASDKDKVNDIINKKPRGLIERLKMAPLVAIGEKNTKAPVPDQKAPTTPIAASKPVSGSVVAANDQNEKYSKANDLPVPEPESKPTVTASDNGIDVIDAGQTQPGDIKQTIAMLSKKAGADPNIMQTFAATESGFNPNAKANTSSASGLFQFTKATWQEQMSKNGRKYGINPNTPPTDVTASSLLASEYVKSNMRLLQGVKPNPNMTDVYLAHFLGPGGARKFLSADPNDLGARVLPDAAKANRSIFYNGNQPRTVGEIYSLISNKLSRVAGQHGINLRSETLQGRPGYNGQPATNLPGYRPGYAGTIPRPIHPNNNPSSTPTYGGSTSGSSTRYPSPDMGTSSTQLPQGKRPSRVFGQQPNVIGYPSTSVVDRAGKNVGDITGVTSILEKSFDVQQEMRDLLKSIAQSVNPENINQIKKAIKEGLQYTGGSQQSTAGVQRTSSAIQPVVDLSRKSA